MKTIFSAQRAVLRFLFDRIADLRDEFFGVICFMRTDVVNVERSVARRIAVGIYPCGKNAVDLVDLVVRAFVGDAGKGDRRQRLESDVFGVGIAAFDGFLRLYIDIGFLVLSWKRTL